VGLEHVLARVSERTLSREHFVDKATISKIYHLIANGYAFHILERCAADVMLSFLGQS